MQPPNLSERPVPRAKAIRVVKAAVGDFTGLSKSLWRVSEGKQSKAYAVVRELVTHYGMETVTDDEIMIGLGEINDGVEVEWEAEELDIEISYVPAADIEMKLKDLHAVPHSGSPVYDGFTFLSPNTATANIDYDADFFVAKTDVDIVGILKVSESVRLGKDTGADNVRSISYVDVRRGYRRQGVAKALCGFADQHYPVGTCLVATDEDGIGHKINIAAKLAKYFQRCKYFQNATAYQNQTKPSHEI